MQKHTNLGSTHKLSHCLFIYYCYFFYLIDLCMHYALYKDYYFDITFSFNATFQFY